MRPSSLRLFALLLLAVAISASAADRWTPPQPTAVPANLPRLTAPLALDGDLSEWSGAASVPVRCRSYISVANKPHEWRGPADASMEFYCGWNADGLCIAAEVSDDDVRNDRQPKDYWQHDCIEVYVDGRGPGKLLTPPYSRGAYQLLIRPPVSGLDAAITTNPRDGAIDGLKIAGLRTAAGYRVGALVPWSAFPELSAEVGSQLGLQFGLNDYDSRDGDKTKPFMLTYLGAMDLWSAPQNLTRWTLRQDLAAGPAAALAPLIALDVPSMFVGPGPMSVSVDLGKSLTRRVSRVRVTAVGQDGNTVLDRPARAGGVQWDCAAVPDGYYGLTATVLDRAGQPIASTTRPVLLLGSAERDAIARIEKAGVATLAADRPLKAAAYLGAAACVERLKRAVEIRSFPEIARAAREIDVRLDLLEGKQPTGDLGMLGLLELASNPDSQVIVEFPNAREASVTFNWGALPMAVANVTLMTPEDAAKAAAGPPGTQPMPLAKLAAGDRLIQVRSVSDKVANRAASLVAAGRPVTPADVDALRMDLVEALRSTAREMAMPPDFHLYCGDLHMHTFHSDGAPSPAGIGLQAMHCLMDYAIVTDHNIVTGALIGRDLFRKHGLAFPYGVGEEITMKWAHMNAYPVRECISPDLSPYDTIKAAHVQGAVIQWNHPSAPDSDWAKAHRDTGGAGTGLDAWEHIPPKYDEWKSAGNLPVITGSTDTHNGAFSYNERTVIFAPSADADDVAEAVRCGRVVALSLHDSRMLYGPDDLIAAVVSALREGRGLKSAAEHRIRLALQTSDVPGLIRASKPRP
mgnify:FL=1